MVAASAASQQPRGWPGRLVLPSALLLVLLAASSGTASAAATRHTLEPADGRAVHCAGQDDATFQHYSAFLGAGARPALKMVYAHTGVGAAGIVGANVSWWRGLAQVNPPSVILQVGLHLPKGDDLAGVANGTYSAELGLLREGLLAFGRPLFVRVGFEFNGEWNDYPPQHYVTAFRAIVQSWRSEPKLSGRVAAVWDASCDSSGDLSDPSLNFSRWYPGDSAVDWWGINVFNSHPASPGHYGATRSSPDDSCVTGFVDAAERAGFPVMLGESTPRMMGANDQPPQLLLSSGDRSSSSGGAGGCLAFNFSLAAQPGRNDSAPLQLLPCDEMSDAQAWRLTAEGYLMNVHGMCVSGSTGTAGECVPPPHHHICALGEPGCAGLLWKLTPEGQLMTLGAHERCLSAAAPAGGGAVAATTDCATASRWKFGQSSVADHRGGLATWQEWFEPYLKLIARRNVKAFCYIDWLWPAQPSGNGACWQHPGCWYSWGDARVETNRSQLIGSRWKAAMADTSIIHGSTEQALCAALGC